MHLSWWIILMGQNDKKGTVSPKQGQLVPMTRIHCCLVESASQQGWNNSTERSVNAPRSPQLRANMKSNYECFVLTASCLIISLPSRPGKVCFDFPDSYTAWCHAASCAKPRPTNNCPYQRLFDPISVPGQWELGWNFHLGTTRFSKAELLPCCSLQVQAAALQDLYWLYLYRRVGPAAHGCSHTAARQSHRRHGLEVQAQTALTEPSARIQSMTGGIRGFWWLTAECTFLQSVCVRGRERRINLTARDFSNYLKGGCKMTI